MKKCPSVYKIARVNPLQIFQWPGVSEYPYFNVQPFDYYNVLTDPNNHHMVEDESVVHVISSDPEDPDHPNELYYYTGTNNHPTSEGHQKATEEYLPLLNAYYNLWQQYR